ncbi:hypothetical protein BELL_0576g00070 [Botrytis elliptica]|uniref:Uncharacterized protein n=1 Tax=Botrytis elliptica TaxID=278938 RepID=A0A4Z1JDW1_9HELO|nr:hypothetical protein EAE99_007239 [Botrytis elliptica]TGO71434.1 hypothetical protein BELL_0576g00070 [Botrytis elliptica]
MARLITPIQQAYLDAYAAACAIVPHNLRQTVILFGGAASIAHGILDRKAKDVDILVGVEALAILDDAIINMREGFHRDTDGTIKWDKLDSANNKLFEVTVELVELGGPFVPRVPEVVSFGEGYVVTLTELVRLRASTLVNRGDEPDYIDFRLLLFKAANMGLTLPPLEEEEVKSMIEAVEMYEGSQDVERMFMDVLGWFELRGVWIDGMGDYMLREEGLKAKLTYLNF